MTRHYTHTSEAAATAAVGLLPDVTGQTTKLALPAASLDRAALHALASNLTARNVKETKAKLLELLASP